MRLVPREGRRQPTIDLSEYVDGLYSYALVLSRNRTEAEDLVQGTCLRAIRAMQRLRPDSNVKSWLFTIVLECPLGTVMSGLARARSKLRDLLSPISVAPRSERTVTSAE